MVKFKEESIQTLLGAFAGMSENYVHALSTDSAGSRALEAFLASGTVPQKAKFRLVDRVTGKSRFTSKFAIISRVFAPDSCVPNAT